VDLLSWIQCFGREDKARHGSNLICRDDSFVNG
jgi:hypothetical protein